MGHVPPPLGPNVALVPPVPQQQAVGANGVDDDVIVLD
jgi:hypothetical protein